MTRAGRRFGRLILTTCRQPCGASLLDGGSTIDDEGIRYGCLVLRRPKSDNALVVGWREAGVPNPSRWLRRRHRAVPMARDHDQGGDMFGRGLSATAQRSNQGDMV